MGRRLVIDLQWPKGTDREHCAQGPEVEQVVSAASLPPAYATCLLTADISMEDAQRIAECIRNQLGPGSGTISLHEVEEPSAE